ncbi:peptidase dimerization domain-containing protein [Saccharopolyspora sp. ASAGF58]|uniref:peptidase dimerization domain-containing protein n=1 Tax=Saccharopolyspora sp. ASAGF58 TaxID=2719023 RepID=UPI001FF0CBFF|nr:peptidase dimerization domain-containing protein [Saccharopolyspora sp. ASAGF58]
MEDEDGVPGAAAGWNRVSAGTSRRSARASGSSPLPRTAWKPTPGTTHRWCQRYHSLAEIISQLTGEADHERGTTINVGTVSGGTARNVIAGKASCLIDIRVSATSLRAPLEPISVGVGSDANLFPRLAFRCSTGSAPAVMAITPGTSP